MRLSDIKGAKSLDIMADAMELAELIGEDGKFSAMVDDFKELGDEKDGAWKVMCRHLPAILRDERYKTRIVSILASASNLTPEEYEAEGPILADLAELFLTDSESLGFLAGSAAKAM